ncbi:MAG: gliding motility-associated-like protein [Crocinitomix sp.]|jgi:gliding motility-associated-like protein
MKFKLLVILSLFLCQSIHAQVFINEFSCSNISNYTDATGDQNDWVELYNSGGTAFDLTGYFISDKSSNLSKREITAGASIPAGGFLKVIFADENAIMGDELHVNLGLAQTKNEWIILSSAAGTIVDSLKIVRMTQKNHSYGRTTDGAGTWSIFTSPNLGASNTGGLNYYTSRPTMSVAPGYYAGTQNVTLSTPDGSATIYYTLDGTVPTESSTVYAGPVSVSATAVLRARAFSSDPSTPASFVETNTYFINDPHDLPIISICGDEVKDFLNDVAPGAFSNNFDGAIEYFEADGSFIDEGEGYYNKHGNDSWAYDQRGMDFVMKDQYGYNYAIQHEIFPSKDRDEYQHLIIKAAANCNYPFEEGGAHIRDAYVHTISQLGDLRMDERTTRLGAIYVNGEYWGVYDFREKVDDADFTSHYYDQPGDEIEFIKTWGGTWAEYGDPTMTEWNDLVTYITTNDMSVDANYEYVNERYNIGSLIDYIVLNSYVVASDWLNWNTAWWKGNNPDGDKKKWRYALWDMDATFGHYINYTGVETTEPDADPCNPEALVDGSDPEGHIQILTSLRANEDFDYYYITRYIDLTNGVLSCDRMIEILDSMTAVIAPEMPNQIARWGGTVTEWEDNVQAMRDYINIRCEAIVTGLIDCYDLEGPYDIMLDVVPAGAGKIKMNSLWVSDFPWTGTYYGGINTVVKTEANPGYIFDHWESINHPFTDPEIPLDTLLFITTDTLIAHFLLIEDDDPVVDPPDPVGYDGIHVPNAFSPNGDGVNDELTLFVGDDVELLDFIIYDRWGNLLFRTSDNLTLWDGTYKGKLLNTGVYTYYLQYSEDEVGQQVLTGNITLMQ